MADDRDEDQSATDAAPAPDTDVPSAADAPLAIGGTPDPDAPSRRPRPRVVALLGEFFWMSRTTAILLAVFVVVGALYLLVKEEPVVHFGPPGSGESTPTENADPAGEEEVDEVTDPESPTGTTSPPSTPGSPPDDDEATGTSPQNQTPATQTAVPEATPTGGATPTGAGAPDAGQGGAQDQGGDAGGGAAPAAE